MANKPSNQVLINYVNKMLNQKRGPDYIKNKLLDYFFCDEAMADEAIYQAKAGRKQKKNNFGKDIVDGRAEKNVPRGTNCDCGGVCGDECDCKEPKEKSLLEQSDEQWAKAELATERRNVMSLKRELGRENALVEQLQASIREIAPAPLKIQKKNLDSKDVSVVAHFTDWHIGEVINNHEMEGFNTFDYSVAEKRVTTYMEKLLDWVKLHRNNYNVSELVFICTGDFISGDIHYELTATNEFPPPMQATKAGGLLAMAVATAAPYFEKIRVEFVVADNHSRLTKKTQCKQGGINSWNFIVSTVAQMMLGKHKNVTFNTHNVLEAVVRVQNKKYLILHGDGIKGVNGIPFYGIQTKIGKEAVARMNMPNEKKFDTIVMGHYHQPAKMVNWMMGGSLSGTTEYDHKAGRCCEACQTAWFVHPSWGEFDFIEFWLGR